MRTVPVGAAMVPLREPIRPDAPLSEVTARELHADDMLEDAVRALSLTDDPGLPVLGAGSREVVGWVTHRDILRTYHREREGLSRPAVPSAERRGVSVPKGAG